MTGQKAGMVKSLSWINPFTIPTVYQIIIIIVVNYHVLVLYYVLSTFKSFLQYLLITNSDSLIAKLTPVFHPSHFEKEDLSHPWILCLARQLALVNGMLGDVKRAET